MWAVDEKQDIKLLWPNSIIHVSLHLPGGPYFGKGVRGILSTSKLLSLPPQNNVGGSLPFSPFHTLIQP